ELGVIPPDCKLTARHAEIPAWDDMDEALKPVLARQMENYAGYLEFTDHHVGRLIDALTGLEILDDTLVYYIIGDNGDDVVDERVVQNLQPGQGVDQAPDVVVSEFQVAGVVLHLAGQHRLERFVHVVPGRDLRVAGGQLAVRRDHAQLFLTGEGLLAQLVPALV